MKNIEISYNLPISLQIQISPSYSIVYDLLNDILSENLKFLFSNYLTNKS